MGQMKVLANTVIKWREDAANRSGVDAAIGMAADSAIDRTRIQTGAATDALQTFPKRRRQHLRSAIIEQNEMEFLGAVNLAGLTRSGDERGVNRERLAGRSACQQFQKNGQIPEARQDFFDAHDRNVNTRAG